MNRTKKNYSTEFSLYIFFYHSKGGNKPFFRLKVMNLDSVYRALYTDSQTIHLVNHSGKLVILWHQIRKRRHVLCVQEKRIGFAVIRLTFLETQI